MVVIFEEADGEVGKAGGIFHFPDGCIRRFPCTYDEDGYLEPPGVAEEFPDDGLFYDHESIGQYGKKAHEEPGDLARDVGEEHEDDGKAYAPEAGVKKPRQELHQFHISGVEAVRKDEDHEDKGHDKVLVEGRDFKISAHEEIPEGHRRPGGRRQCHIVAGHEYES